MTGYYRVDEALKLENLPTNRATEELVDGLVAAHEVVKAKHQGYVRGNLFREDLIGSQRVYSVRSTGGRKECLRSAGTRVRASRKV